MHLHATNEKETCALPSSPDIEVVKTQNVTPRLDYASLATPELKKELTRYGIRQLSRKQASTVLNRIYDDTHPQSLRFKFNCEPSQSAVSCKNQAKTNKRCKKRAVEKNQTLKQIPYISVEDVTESNNEQQQSVQEESLSDTLLNKIGDDFDVVVSANQKHIPMPAYQQSQVLPGCSISEEATVTNRQQPEFLPHCSISEEVTVVKSFNELDSCRKSPCDVTVERLEFDMNYSSNSMTPSLFTPKPIPPRVLDACGESSDDFAVKKSSDTSTPIRVTDANKNSTTNLIHRISEPRNSIAESSDTEDELSFSQRVKLRTGLKYPPLNDADGSDTGDTVKQSDDSSEEEEESPFDNEMFAPLEESILCLSQSSSSDGTVCDDDAPEIKRSQSLQNANEKKKKGGDNCEADLLSCIKGNLELYQRILLYEPIPFCEIKAFVSNEGIKCSTHKLIDFLDKMCITFSLKEEGRTFKPGGRKRKRKA